MIRQPSFGEFPFFAALALLLVLSGLLIRFLASLASMELRKHAFVLDELTSQLLPRKNFLQTFARICVWNVLVSLIVICSGAITLGILPMVWAFFNLGLFFPDVNLFKLYLYPWIEEAANILSVALGIWIGQTLYVFSGSFPIFAWITIIISSLYVISALLEAFEIHQL